MIPIFILIFLLSMVALSWSGSWLVSSLLRISRYLGWREFVVAFFIMAFAGSLPNFAVGIMSALQGIPELSFGDVVGGNVVDLTLAISLVILISRSSIPAEGATVQTSSLFSSVIAVLPLILILDGKLSRADGLVLILAFLVYIAWLFARGDRFKKPYDGSEEKMPPVKEFKEVIKAGGKALLGFLILGLAAQGVVISVSFFAKTLGLPIPVIGILIVGLGNCLPEIYFAILAARRGKTEMILGDLMGSVIVPATLVLGVVVLIHPIRIVDFSPFAIARAFLIIAAILFYVAARTGKKITRTEAWQLLGIYILFVAIEILTK